MTTMTIAPQTDRLHRRAGDLEARRQSRRVLARAKRATR
jgi:hypothetical protein